MCLKPIKIYNRSRSFTPFTHKATMSVACGKCEQCQKKKQNDWLFRSVAEMQRVSKLKGFVLFPTLTYRNSDLPCWYDSEFDYNIPVFDKSHFVSFRTKLRVYLKRAGFDFSGDNTIRYLYVTEYGEKKGRSHIHCLLFIPFDISITLLKSLVKKAWIYGFVMYSKKGAKVQSVKGLEYVMKYMHKDMLYYNKYKVDDYIQLLKDKSELTDITEDERNRLHSKLLAFMRHLPHHCQSMGFGSTFQLSDDDYIKGTIKPSRLGIMDSTFQYSIPLYYKRKFLYDFDKLNKVFTINERGIKIKQMSFDNTLYSLTKYYDTIIYSNRIEDICKVDFPNVLNDPGYALFKKYQSNIDTLDLAIYSLCYRGLTLSKNNWISLNDMSSIDFLKQNKDNAYFYYMSSVGRPLIHEDYLNNGAKLASQCHGFSDVNIYRDFESLLIFIEYFEMVLGQSQDNALIKQHINQRIQLATSLI